MSRIVIAAREPLFAAGLRGIFGAAGMDAPETCIDIRDLHERFLARAPDLAIVDWALLNGLVALEDLRNAAPACRLILCAREAPAASPEDLIQLGVRAIVPFTVEAGELLQVVNAATAAPAPQAARAGEVVADCTDDERRLVSLVAQGMTDQEIAAELQWPCRSVKSSVAALIRRLGLSSRGELALYGLATRHLYQEQ